MGFVFVLFIASALSKSVFKHEAIGDITSTHAEKTANGIAVKASAAGDKTPLLRIRKMLELQPQRWQARQIPRLRMHQPQFRVQASTTRLPSSTPRPAPCTSRALTPTTRPTMPPPTTTGSVPAPTGTTSTTALRLLIETVSPFGLY